MMMIYSAPTAELNHEWKCSNCGSTVNKDDTFCFNCGNKI